MDETKKVESGEVEVVAEIKISFLSDGKMHLYSSTKDKILVFGLLEMAKQMFSPKQHNLIQVPELDTPLDLRGKIPG